MGRKIVVTEELVRRILAPSAPNYGAFHDCFEVATRDQGARNALQTVINEMPNVAKRAVGIIGIQFRPTTATKKLMADLVDHNPVVQRARIEPAHRVSR
jgi:hypothetical protein